MPRMLFPIFWVEQKGLIDASIVSELRSVRAVLDWGSTVCALTAVFFALFVIIIVCCTKKPEYNKPHDSLGSCEKPKDEAEIKLTPN